MSPSSSGFKTKLAASGYYGITAADGNRRTLTPRGEALTSGDDARFREARREAVMGTNFGPVIHSLRGRQISEATIALRLQSDLEVPQASAPNVAKALIESARYAELLSEDDRLDAAAIEGVAHVIPQANDTPTRARLSVPHREQRGSETPKKPKPPKPEEPKPKDETRPFVPGVQVVVKIDASSLSPQQIAELVRELRRDSS